jgi:hypothetical protein
LITKYFRNRGASHLGLLAPKRHHKLSRISRSEAIPRNGVGQTFWNRFQSV